MNRFHILLTAVAICGIGFTQAHAALTAADYCDVKITAPASVKESTPLSDGVSYAAISSDGEKIEIFSYKTGERTGVLFDIKTVKGAVKISSFEGFAISANEKKILLWNDSKQIYRRSHTAQYYVYDIMRQTLAKVSEGGPQRCGLISHDGRMVAYVRDNNIFVSNLEYGTDVQVTKDGETNKVINGAPDWGYEEEFGIDNTMCWSGDDSSLAFVRFDESEVPMYSFDIYRSYCEGDYLSDIYPEAYSYKYPLAGSPNSVVTAHVYDVETRKVKKMDLPLVSTDYIPGIKFDYSGTRLMVMVLNRDQNHLRLFAVNPQSTVGRQIMEDRSKTWLSTSAYQMVDYQPDGFVIGSDRSGWRHLYEYEYSGKLRRQLTSGEFNVTDYYGYNPRLGTHYMQTTLKGAINRNIASVDAKGTIKLLHDMAGYESATFSCGCEYYLRNWSSATVPPQYTLWTAAGKKLKDVELNKAYAAKYSSIPMREFITVRNDAGEEMNASIMRPAGADASTPLPLVMYQYNGPESQEVLNKWKLTGETYLASQGYVVASVDGRGTGGRSRKWSDAVYKDLGHYETADQIAGAKAIASLPGIDGSRMACWGWSYGGYMTLRELTQAGTPFKAGVAMAAVTDWRFYDSIYTERYMLTPQQNQAGYTAASVLPRTTELSGRLLIMSGTSDDNVHFYNTLKFASKANYEGKVFEMMALAGFEHSLRMCNAREMLYGKILDFLNNNLK